MGQLCYVQTLAIQKQEQVSTNKSIINVTCVAVVLCTNSGNMGVSMSEAQLIECFFACSCIPSKKGNKRAQFGSAVPGASKFLFLGEVHLNQIPWKEPILEA